MTSPPKPRLRYFEQSGSQRHIVGDDLYLYRQDPPRYKASIIGTGTIGQEHMRVATMLGRIAVHGIYDEAAVSMKVAVEEFAKYSDTSLKTYANLDSACNDPDVDVLFICTPNFSHIDVLEVAARSGKPIFLEKPMATTLADACRIVEIADEYPAFIQVGLQYRYKAPYVEARHEVLTRQIAGPVKTISMREYRPPFLDKVNQWNKFSRLSGGTLVEKCCHYFDLLNLFAQSEPVRVYATGDQAVNFTDFEKAGERSDIDDSAMVLVDYENGIRASFTLAMFCPDFYEDLVICGDKGRVIATEQFNFQRSDCAKSTLSVELGELGASRTTDVGYTRAIEQSGHHGSTFFEHLALANQMDGQSVDSATPIEGLWSIIVASAAQESLGSKSAVNITEFIRSNGLDHILKR
ncbi:MAG: Gfo/Idh/MocA family oxidoreductase [Pseudomonadota bacterium]